jgi:O-acetyl-ADP-ribose deacetylase (regulator of RNase III)
MRDRLKLVEDDITRLAVDAIVNAANTTLMGGGGVDGAIHEVAGPELRAECRWFGGCETGDARLTHGYKLRARHVIHTVGPVWRNGREGEPAQLASCYRRSLEIAAAHRFRTVAFPSISTGAYTYPVERAARVAIATCVEFLQGSPYPEVVTLVAFGRRDHQVYRMAMEELLGGTRAPVKG